MTKKSTTTPNSQIRAVQRELSAVIKERDALSATITELNRRIASLEALCARAGVRLTDRAATPQQPVRPFIPVQEERPFVCARCGTNAIAQSRRAPDLCVRCERLPK